MTIPLAHYNNARYSLCMKTTELIRMAQHKASNATSSMRSSAELAADDAAWLWAEGLYESAKRRALDSLEYSMGVFAARRMVA
jgi:hypothetical protein